MNNLISIIEAQQKGHINDDVYMVGEQLKDMARREPKLVSILAQDLRLANMSIEKAAAELKAYADKNRKSAKCFCVSPLVAEGILREFYGLPKSDGGDVPAVSKVNYLDLASFM